MSFRLVSTPIDAVWSSPRDEPRPLAPGLRDAFLDAPGVAERLRRLEDPEARVVTTGQQPGLLTGPLYTIYKALSAAALARQLEHRWGRPVVPVFWVAGDDHDFAEGSVVAWHGPEGGCTTHVLRERAADAPMVPLAREPVGPEIDPVLSRLEADLPPSEFRAETMEWLRRHYAADRTLGVAFGGAIAELLAPYGVLCLDASHPAVKRAGAPVLTGALRAAQALDQDLATLRDRRIDEGRDVSVQLGDGAALVFLEGAMGRDRLVLQGEGFATRRGGEAWSLEALVDLAERDPGRLSPNVLLRPVLEAAILPTVAYLAGPGELRYFPLTAPVYAALGIRPQPAIPRWSGLLVESRIERLLDKNGVALEGLREPGVLEARVARDALPEELLDTFGRLRTDIERAYEAILQGAVAIDPTMEKPVLSARNHALSGSQDVERKLLQHQKKRSATALSQIARAREALYPGGKAQERTVTIAPFLARYGRDLLAHLSAEIEAWYADALDRPGTPRVD